MILLVIFAGPFLGLLVALSVDAFIYSATGGNRRRAVIAGEETRDFARRLRILADVVDGRGSEGCWVADNLRHLARDVEEGRRRV